MTDADNMIDVAESKFQQLVGQYTSCIGKAKKTVIGKDGPQSHRTCVQDAFDA